MKKLILPLLIAALAMPVAALACPGKGMGQGDGKRGGHIQKMDTNGDGAISAEEHAAGAAQRFAIMDTNGDGKISADEMKGHWKDKHKKCPLKEDCPGGKDCQANQGS